MRWAGNRQRPFVNDRHNALCVGHKKILASLIHAYSTTENRSCGVRQAQTSPMEKSILSLDECEVNGRILPSVGGVDPDMGTATTFSQKMFWDHPSQATDPNSVFSCPLSSLHCPRHTGGQDSAPTAFGRKDELSRSQQSLQHRPAVKTRAAPGLSIVGYPTPRYD
jgi:hypothetical protein